MDVYDFLTITVAILALVVSVTAVWYNAVQTKKTGEALVLQQQIARGNLIEHFTTRFFELLKEGDLHARIDEEQWAYQYWSLLATEFYFFHHGVLPPFMYSLWMIDLAKLYRGENGEHIWDSHSNYLDTYSINYSLMMEFFEKIRELALGSDDDTARNMAISEFVFDWIKANERHVLA